MSELKIDRNSPVPLYLQIAQGFHEQVASGELRPGSSLGSEAELTKRFAVSRVTLRQAMALLVEQGVVNRRHGKGTFVEAAPLTYPLHELLGTTEVISAHGRQWRSRVVSMRRITASTEVARVLQVPRGSRIVEICRLDYAGSNPLAVAYIRLPSAVARGLTADDLEHQPLYPLLKDKEGLTATSANQTLRAAEATSAVAEFLNIDAGAALMIAARVTQTAEGRPVEFSEIFFRADAVRFSITLRRSGHVDEYPIRFQEHHVRVRSRLCRPRTGRVRVGRREERVGRGPNPSGLE